MNFKIFLNFTAPVGELLCGGGYLGETRIPAR